MKIITNLRKLGIDKAGKIKFWRWPKKFQASAKILVSAPKTNVSGDPALGHLMTLLDHLVTHVGYG
jgi:hypothetical protein